MKVASQISLLAVLCFVVLLVGCESELGSRPDDDSLSQGTYSNRYFGFSMQLPEAWAVASAETKEAITDGGAAAISEGSSARRAALDEALANTYQLLTVSRHEIGSPVSSNAILQVVAERVSQAPGIQSGKDYLFHVDAILTGGSLPYVADGGPELQEVGGRRMFLRNYQIQSNQQNLSQSYVALVDRGYALSFILSYTTPEEKGQLEEILRSVQFRDQ